MPSLCLFGVVFGAGKDLDSLIEDIFQRPVDATTKQPNLQPNSGIVSDLVNSCTCVPYYQCNNGTLNTNGENIIDIR